MDTHSETASQPISGTAGQPIRETAGQRDREPGGEKKRRYTPTPPLPPPPPGVDLVTREEAAEILGLAFGWFGKMEMLGRVPRQRYRNRRGVGGGVGVGNGPQPILYARADIESLREERRREEESYTNPQPHPDLPNVSLVAIRSHVHTLFALIDASDVPRVQGRCWNWRPASQQGRPGEVLLSGLTDNTPLKRIILGLENAGKEVNITYANGDPLDCRRCNLVVRSNAEKGAAARMKGKPAKGGSSKYKGVLWEKTRRMWKAQIGAKETFEIIGRFGDEVEAALAYDAAARERWGDQTFLNFPGGPETAPPRTGLGPDGQPVREKQKYTVTPPLPPPPQGVAVMDREQAADFLGVSPDTFHHWCKAGRVTIPRYRLKPITGTPILYAVADLQRLRDQFAQEGAPYPDPQNPGVYRVPIWTKQGGIEALVDAQDLGIVQGRVWNYVRDTSVHGDERGCVVLNGPRGTEHTPLKRIIMNVLDKGDTLHVVHKNGNPLDCRRGNLELRTPAQTGVRDFKHTHRCGEPCTSIYKGVYWSERYGCWIAQIRVNNTNRRLGKFDNESDAARAYDDAAREAWGKEARVNFPEQGELSSALRDTSSNNLSTPLVQDARDSRRYAA